MNGVVLWSCANTCRAIVWCDDHGQLAFALDEFCFADTSDFPNVGDLVFFNLQVNGAVRNCVDLRVVVRDSHPEIAQNLRRASERRPKLTVVPTSQVA